MFSKTLTSLAFGCHTLITGGKLKQFSMAIMFLSLISNLIMNLIPRVSLLPSPLCSVTSLPAWN